MKKIKNIRLGKVALFVAMAFTATACQQDEIIEQAKPMPQGEYISFHIQRGWDYDEISRSADNEYGNHLSDHILASDSQGESIQMSAYQQPIDTWFNAESRGTMIEKAAFNEFMAFGYQTKDGTTTQIFNTYHKKGENATMWEKPVDTTAGSENANGYYWPGADYTCSFFGIAMSDGKLTTQDFYSNVTTTTNDAGQIVSFDYTVPDAAIDQPDIMVASSGNVAGDGSQGATLNFKHILSAINIKVGTDNVSDNITSITINSITFNNIYAKGAYTIATGAWTNTVFYSVTKSFKVDFNGLTSGEGTYTGFKDNDGELMNGTGATLMLLPQTLRNDATITVSYKLNNTTYSATANIGGNVWEAGKAINYVLNIDNSDGIEFLTQDSYQDAHYIILPLNIKYQFGSTSKPTATLRAIDVATGETADWVQFRSSLVEVENDGWWADPNNVWNVDDNENTADTKNTTAYARTNTLNFTAAGQYFAFLTENTGDTNRQVRFELVEGDIVQDEITITQLCPTWNGVKGCERIEEGEPLPWGYSWKLNEGQTEYKTTITVPAGFLGLTRLWAIFIYYLYGQPATFEGSGKYTFDYTSFINGMSNSETGAGSSENGLGNTTYMFNYSGGGSMTGLYSYFVNSLGATINSSTFEGISYTEYATKEALKKNKVRVNIAKNTTNEMHNPIIEATRTDLWYLPATGEVSTLQNNENMIQGVETKMNNGDIFWTSTAAEAPNAYSYTFGGNTQEEDRDNAHRIRAIRQKTTTE